MLLWHAIFPLFFLFRDSPCLFLNKNKTETDTYYGAFCGMDGWTVLTSFRGIARGYMMCTWILIMKAWNEFS
jgi:hypothetical protein